MHTHELQIMEVDCMYLLLQMVSNKQTLGIQSMYRLDQVSDQQEQIMVECNFKLVKRFMKI